MPLSVHMYTHASLDTHVWRDEEIKKCVWDKFLGVCVCIERGRDSDRDQGTCPIHTYVRNKVLSLP